jgi:hypothetical protein
VGRDQNVSKQVLQMNFLRRNKGKRKDNGGKNQESLTPEI